MRILWFKKNHQLCDVFGEHAMSSSVVRRWARLMKDAKMCMMICGAADRLWWTKIWLGTIRSSPLQPRLGAKWFPFVPASQILPCWPAVPQRQRGQRSCYHVLCIAGGIVLQWSDTKTGAPLWHVPQQWWKLYQKVVYSMYIKWQYKLVCNIFLFFLNSPSELTFWITLVAYEIMYVLVIQFWFRILRPCSVNQYVYLYVMWYWDVYQIQLMSITPFRISVSYLCNIKYVALLH